MSSIYLIYNIGDEALTSTDYLTDATSWTNSPLLPAKVAIN